MQTWKIEVTMTVADSWIADGFNLAERVQRGEIVEHMQELLPYAYGHEVVVKVKVLKAPDERVIKNLQEGLVECKD